MLYHAAFLFALVSPLPPAAQTSQVAIPLVGNIPAQCVSQPFRVLVENGVVTVTQYLRCNHAGRYVIRLGDATKSQWSGTVARHKQAQRSLDSGATDFAVVAGSGATETFTIVPRNPGAAKDIAKYISTIVFVQ